MCVPRLDDLGRRLEPPDPVLRVVSLVPSLTEALEVSSPGIVVGATVWCTHPANLEVVRVGGTKDPDVARIVALAPDLVVADREENRRADVEALADAGIAVHVTDIRSLEGAFESLARVLGSCGLGRPQWLVDAEDAWRSLPEPAVRRRVLLPVWRDPWRAAGPDTFAASVLAALGADVVAHGPGRYPAFDPARVDADLVVLPDEPYPFAADDGPEAFPGVPVVLVSGRLLTWYGPALNQAASVLPGLLA